MPINPYNNGQVPQAPFGDIFAVRTPKIDAAANRMQMQYWQQRQYEQQQRLAQAAQLDKDYDRQMTGVWEPDVPKIADKYNTYKQIKSKLLFDPSLQKDMVARAKTEAEAYRALADFHGAVATSKRTPAYFKQMVTEWGKKPSHFKNGADEQFIKANGMTTDDLIANGLLSAGAWQAVDEDLTPIEKLARGKDRSFMVLEDAGANGGLTRRNMLYNAPNEPWAYQTAWLTGLTTKGRADTAERALDNISDGEFAAAETAYNNSLHDKARWAKWGVAPQPISYHPDIPVEKYAAYKTFRHFLDNEPAGKEVDRPNTDKVIDKNFANRLKAMAIGQGYKKELMGLREALKKKGEDDTWAFQATDAYEGEDPAKLQDVMQRLFAGNKTGITLGQIKQAPDGGMVVPITRKVKGPYGQMVDQYEEVAFQRGDPMNVYKFAKLQQTVLGMPAKMVQALGTGRTAPRATKPTGASTVPGKKTKKKKLY